MAKRSPVLVLGEGLSTIEIVAMACVVVASVGATRTRQASAPPLID